MVKLLGLVREFSVIFNKKSTIFEGEVQIINKNKCDIVIEDKNKCSQYIGSVIENIKVKKSSDKILKRLNSIGSKGINNLVDFTNFLFI